MDTRAQEQEWGGGGRAETGLLPLLGTPRGHHLDVGGNASAGWREVSGGKSVQEEEGKWVEW